MTRRDFDSGSSSSSKLAACVLPRGHHPEPKPLHEALPERMVAAIEQHRLRRQAIQDQNNNRQRAPHSRRNPARPGLEPPFFLAAAAQPAHQLVAAALRAPAPAVLPAVPAIAVPAPRVPLAWGGAAGVAAAAGAAVGIMDPRAPHHPNLQLPPDVVRLIAVRDVNGAKISVGEDNLISYLPERPVGTAVYRFHETLSPGGRCYFEVEVVNLVKGGQIVVGLMPYEACQRIATASPVGSTENSIGLNLNGGLLLQSSSAPSHFGPRCCNRDIVGIGLQFGSRLSGFKNNVSVFFTYNGREFGSRDVVLIGQRFVPAVSLNQPGERVRFRLDATWPPRPYDDGEEMQCDHFDDLWSRLTNVRLNGDIIEYVGSGLRSNDVGLAQATHPLTPGAHYFELEICEPGESCYIAIGVAHRRYPFRQHPGWSKGSIAYHADDGEIFVEKGVGEERGPVCGRGDRMGCGILFPPNFEEARLTALEDGAADGDANEGGERGVASLEARCREDIQKRIMLQQYRRRGDNQRYRIHRQLQAAAYGLVAVGDAAAAAVGAAGGGGGGGGGGAGAPVELWSQSRVEIDDYVPYEQLDCGVRVKVFFTRNGQIVCTKEMALPQEGFYPTVGLLSRGERVRVDLQPLSG